jgi:ABC-2 type transport system ATP-binding protein
MASEEEGARNGVVLRHLQKVINQRTAVAIEKLEVVGGEIAALVGPPGSGKEPLLELLLGRSRPTAGEVRLAGIDPAVQKRQLGHRVGRLFAENGLYKHLSPLATLTFQCRLYGLPRSRAVEVLSSVGLADHAEEKLDKLSSGLKRRLAFGRVVLHKPTVMLLEEPFANCDGASISLLSSLIRRLVGDGGAALILADNNAHLAPLCDTIYTLEGGRIVGEVHTAEEQDVTLPFKIPVRLEGSIALVNPVDILYALTKEGRTYLQTAEDRLPTQFTMTQLEERLARSGFFRAHRGYLVNLQHVKEVIPFTRSSFSLKLNDPGQTLIPLSKEAARELRELLGY